MRFTTKWANFAGKNTDYIWDTDYISVKFKNIGFCILNKF